jgi:hypothetical protein
MEAWRREWSHFSRKLEWERNLEMRFKLFAWDVFVEPACNHLVDQPSLSKNSAQHTSRNICAIFLYISYIRLKCIGSKRWFWLKHSPSLIQNMTQVCIKAMRFLQSMMFTICCFWILIVSGFFLFHSFILMIDHGVWSNVDAKI